MSLRSLEASTVATNQEAQVESIKRIKVLAIGDPFVGKSCLIKRYCENKARPNSKIHH
jgi:GTPase SAR1 family protein